jgi:Holliday junction DNA helicase RuvB
MEIIGNKRTKNQLDIAVGAAEKRNAAIPHIMFSGAPGCGKTSLARFLAQKTGFPFLSIVPESIKDYKSTLSLFDRLDHSGYDERGNRVGKINPTILFLDEVHNLPIKGQELLGLAMERFIIESTEPNMYFWIPQFTVVGATTLAGNLSKPFLDRFKMTFSFQPYDMDDMEEIVKYHSDRMKVRITPRAITEIAKRSRGTPRVAVRFIERVKDKMSHIGSSFATTTLVKGTFKDLGVDGEGFTTLELRILKSLLDASKPVSLDNLSTILQEDAKSIKGYAEPYLIRQGMLLVSGKGRIITEKGAQYLNKSGEAGRLVKEKIPFDYNRK